MVAFGLVVHASVLQCGRRTAMSDARADMLKSFGYPTADTVARAQAYHDILTDLIAQLRQIRQDGQSEADNHCWECGCIGECDPATTTATPCWPCATTLAADRAEARLREVSGDE